MSLLTQTDRWTYQRMLEELASETPYELINNELLPMSSPSLQHQEITGEIYSLLKAFARQHALGKVYTAPTDVILAEQVVVIPDVVFVSEAKQFILAERGIMGAPDLVVEVVSPSSYHRDNVEKKDLYERYGVAEYWIVDPANRVVEILSLTDNRYTLHGFAAQKGTVNSTVLASFTLGLEELFGPVKS